MAKTQTCPRCNIVVARANFNKHLKDNHPIMCKRCGRKYALQEHLDSHYRDADADIHPKCKPCQLGFKGQSELDVHNSSTHARLVTPPVAAPSPKVLPPSFSGPSKLSSRVEPALSKVGSVIRESESPITPTPLTVPREVLEVLSESKKRAEDHPPVSPHTVEDQIDDTYSVVSYLTSRTPSPLPLRAESERAQDQWAGFDDSAPGLSLDDPDALLYDISPDTNRSRQDEQPGQDSHSNQPNDSGHASTSSTLRTDEPRHENEDQQLPPTSPHVEANKQSSAGRASPGSPVAPVSNHADPAVRFCRRDPCVEVTATVCGHIFCNK
ncbi:hypothetical protein HETIRDRAFT_446707 [Heterobasidion irregulare TC 32-1]|uniref:C2H2-type domain-containing protein n=1 Tax=Heterobasidion irregulare (strain TC 32-1) TaxID=747525 RepID=W4JQU2_HETIT|nr:uncharacterized protein HETIRDRAFT_446707 [Heterobasidion irregulare TC 32-1]ETW75829.1 hypothetical protein HETIRDRAFT_446707 [Heterobasidion irregulare TC 32-1]